ncbi:MAG: acetyltransferase [Ignavibacteria bacterium]|nr:acetyltransferase [Ignavibacteria bacterium]MBT8390585.1 acetyltransferase [Ignavibacteria bacterium]
MDEKLIIDATSRSFIADKTFYVLGDGGFAKEVRQLMLDCGAKNIAMLGKNDEVKILRNDFALLGVGTPEIKIKIVSDLQQKIDLPKFINVCHPTSIVGNTAFGKGNIVCAGTIFTVDVQVNDFNAFNLNCTVGHGCKIGSYNQVNPGTNISGGVTIGDRCLIGTGVQILEDLNICSDVIIGAGAVVSKDIVQEGIYVGIPARKIEKKK